MAKTTKARLPSGRTEVDDGERKRKEAEYRKVSVASLTEDETSAEAMRVIVYSDPGVGKTTFLAHCPKCVFLDVEDGARQYRVPRWKAQLDSLEALRDAIDALLYGEHDFRAVAIESLDAVEELIKRDIEKKLRALASEDPKAPTTIAALNEEEFGAGYELLRDGWRDLLGRLDALRNRPAGPMHVLLSAHGKVENVPNLDGKDFKRNTIQVDGQKPCKLILRWADYVLFFRSDVAFMQEDSRSRKMLAVTGGRWAYCTPAATHVAKCRGTIPWPDRFELDEDVGWSTFQRTAELITKHDANLPTFLRGEFERVLPTIPQEKQKRAQEVFESAMAQRLYSSACRVIEQADRQEAERRKAEKEEQKEGQGRQNGQSQQQSREASEPEGVDAT